MFQLDADEREALRSQSVISNAPGRDGRRYPPYAFTEQGVAMLSSVLNRRRAIAVNIEIMRAFVRLREIIASNKDWPGAWTSSKPESRESSALTTKPSPTFWMPSARSCIRPSPQRSDASASCRTTSGALWQAVRNNLEQTLVAQHDRPQSQSPCAFAVGYAWCASDVLCRHRVLFACVHDAGAEKARSKITLGIGRKRCFNQAFG